MTANNIDWNQLLRIVAPAALVIAAIFYILVRKFVIQVWQLWQQDQASRKALALRSRSTQATGQNARVITRKTDLHSKLDSQGRKMHAYAEKLLAHNHIKEAAKIFESIQFQRRAIDVLEARGMIPEAAAVLMRMNLPNRAGALYERNHRLKEAAEHFLQAGDQAAAARVFKKLADDDFRYLKQAAECYYLAGMMDQSLDCYRKLASPQDVLRICLQSHKYDFLIEYLQLPIYVNAIIPKLDQQKLEELIQHIELNPHQAGLMAHWLGCQLSIQILSLVLTRLSVDQDCRQVFWQRLSSRMLSLICQLLAKHPRQLTSEVYRLHGQTILAIGHQEHGNYFMQLAEFTKSASNN